jgi:hypothetical protein
VIDGRTLAMVVGLALPSLLAGQEPDLAARVDEPTLAAVRPLLAEAARDSLPMHALRAKVLEGVAKRVPAEQIGRVVAELADELRTVRSGLRQGMPSTRVGDGELLAAALAIRQGVSFDLLEEVWASRPEGAQLDVPVTVLGELARRGIPARDATDLMAHVVRERVPVHLAAQIPGTFDGARGRGMPAAAALAQTLRVLNIPDPPGRRPPR